MVSPVPHETPVPKGGGMSVPARGTREIHAVKFPCRHRGIFILPTFFRNTKKQREILRYDYCLKEVFQTCYKTVTIHTNPPCVTEYVTCAALIRVKLGFLKPGLIVRVMLLSGQENH